ncbi:hypothetical protein ACLESD_49300 [Pyxidicoccus sp. 3LFB2]
MAELSQGAERETRTKLPLGLVLRWLMSLGGILTVFGGLHAYIAIRLFVSPGWPGPWHVLGPVLVALLFASLPVGMAMTRREPTVWTRALQWTSFVWLGTFGILVSTVVAADLVGWVLRWTGVVADPLALARGRALGMVGVAVPAAVFAFVTARGGPGWSG